MYEHSVNAPNYKRCININRREAAVRAATWRRREEEKAVCRVKPDRGRRGGRHRRQISDRQRHETVVLLDVSLEDIWTRAENALESGSVQLHALQGATGHHGGGARAVHQERDFTWWGEKTRGWWAPTGHIARGHASPSSEETRLTGLTNSVT